MLTTPNNGKVYWDLTRMLTAISCRNSCVPWLEGAPFPSPSMRSRLIATCFPANMPRYTLPKPPRPMLRDGGKHARNSEDVLQK